MQATHAHDVDMPTAASTDPPQSTVPPAQDATLQRMQQADMGAKGKRVRRRRAKLGAQGKGEEEKPTAS